MLWTPTLHQLQVQLFVPLEGLELPLLAPSQGRLLVESSECWTYNLRSFVVHIGELAKT